MEAIPLLEEAQREWKQHAELGFVGPNLLTALSMVANPRNPDDARKVVALAREFDCPCTRNHDRRAAPNWQVCSQPAAWGC